MRRLFNFIKTAVQKKPKTHVPWRIYESYDKGEIFDKEILPFINRAAELCKKHEIPYLFWTIPVCVSDGNGNARGRSFVEAWTDRQIAKRMRLFWGAAAGKCSAEDLARGILSHIDK